MILPKNFKLVRNEDETGVSGVGIVAFGTVFPCGKTVIVWETCNPSKEAKGINSITIYECFEQVEKIHGHGGKTVVEFI